LHAAASVFRSEYIKLFLQRIHRNPHFSEPNGIWRRIQSTMKNSSYTEIISEKLKESMIFNVVFLMNRKPLPTAKVSTTFVKHKLSWENRSDMTTNSSNANNILFASIFSVDLIAIKFVTLWRKINLSFIFATTRHKLETCASWTALHRTYNYANIIPDNVTR